MREPVYFIPIFTTLMALVFATVVARRWRERRSGPHLLWWTFGILTYGAGTLTEASVTLFGWHEALFKAWYITGALLGGAPLAQGHRSCRRNPRPPDRQRPRDAPRSAK